MEALTAHGPLDSCSICLKVFGCDELGGCYGCGESICDDCPHFACSCIDDEPMMLELRMRLRQYAIELAALRNQKIMNAVEHLTAEQEARLLLLTDLVASLRDEVNKMDEVKYGETYGDDDSYSVET